MSRFAFKSRRLIPCLTLMSLGWIALPVRAADDHPITRVGRAHPYLALRAVSGDDVFVLDQHRGKKVIMLHFAAWDEASRASIDEWQKAADRLKSDENVKFVGIFHDLHRDRAALFVRWKNLQFPAYFDALNCIDARKLPRAVCVDEHGLVRRITAGPEPLKEQFLSKSFSPDPLAERPPNPKEPDFRVTKRTAGEARRCFEYIEHGDACVFPDVPELLRDAIEAYQNALKDRPNDPAAAFRLGTAYWKRYESQRREPGDLQRAFEAWGFAANHDSENHVIAERVRQFGVTSDKILAGYSWLPDACRSQHRDGADCGIHPYPIPIELASHAPFAAATATPPDLPTIPATSDALQVDFGIVRATRNPKDDLVNVVVALRPASATLDTSKPVQVWVEPPAGAAVSDRWLEATPTRDAAGDTLVMFSVAVRPSKGTTPTTLKFVTAASGVRHDFEIVITAAAPKMLVE